MGAISEKTRVMYERIFRTITNQAEESTPEGTEMAPVDLVYNAWGYYTKGHICVRTWRMRKSAMKLEFTKMGTPEAMEAIDVLDTITLKGNRPVLPKRTSQKKEKRISLSDEDAFLKHLLKRKAQGKVLAGVLHDWLVATRYIGARPCEWEGSETNGRYVRLNNAKNTHGRSHGDRRTVPIDYLPQEIRETIVRHVNYVQQYLEMDKFYSTLQLSMANTIYRESGVCWPRRKTRISLYTFRHQFSANLKATGLDKDEVAALMGHASNETAGRHYARKLVGNPVDVIYASTDDLRRVRHLNRNRKPSGHVRKNEMDKDNQ